MGFLARFLRRLRLLIVGDRFRGFEKRGTSILYMPSSLVVDDEPAVRRYVIAILQSENFLTLEAEDGAQALQMVRELDGDVDLIVSDIQMPNVDGLNLANAVKKSFPAVPVILVSGNGRPDAGFEFVKKPFLPATLIGVVRKLFAR
jgi:two-component system cell cycle sensor histidine kinase/response regulator CckA